ncbi:MAG: acyl-CoA dehydrogenase family protein, partial [Patescibacteria group bacterium]
GTLIIEKDFDKHCLHCSPTSTIVFQNCVVPTLNILGGEEMGWPIAMTTLTMSRSMIAAQGVGLAQSALDEAVKYILERKQFKKMLASFQRVQGQLARMDMMIDAARLLGYRAAWLADELGPENSLDFAAEASKAKLYTSEIAEEVTMIAEELHGGMGVMTEFRIGSIRNNARVLKIYEGTSAIQEYIIARQLLAKHGFKI